MTTKLQRVRDLLRDGKGTEALRLVNTFGRLGAEGAVIRRGYAAVTNPAFYGRELGQDVDALFRAAIDAIRSKYDIPNPMETTVTDFDALADAGFEVAGTNEGGLPLYTRTLPDGRVIVTGDEAKGAGVWGADIYPSAAVFEAGTNRRPFPGVYTDSRALVAALRSAGFPV